MDTKEAGKFMLSALAVDLAVKVKLSQYMMDTQLRICKIFFLPETWPEGHAAPAGRIQITAKPHRILRL